MTLYDVVKEEAALLGRTYTDKECEHIIWTHTGYPSFWPDRTKTPEQNFRQQIREFMESTTDGGEP